jgi:hypothetical protein
VSLALPPYARELLTARKRGLHPNVFVHAGDRAWERARFRLPPNVLCLPPDALFADYDWQCIRGLYPTLIVWNRPPDFVDGFARHLVQSGARMVAALGALHNGERVIDCSPVYYKPTAARRAA